MKWTKFRNYVISEEEDRQVVEMCYLFRLFQIIVEIWWWWQYNNHVLLSFTSCGGSNPRISNISFEGVMS